MKNKFIILALLALLGSCKDENKPFLTLPSYDVQRFDSNAFERLLYVQTNVTYTAVSSQPSWCTTEVRQGKDFNYLVIKVTENISDTERTAEITLTAAGLETVIIDVVQGALSWKLAWSDEFSTNGFIDPAKWKKMPCWEGTGPFDYMSDYAGLFDVKDGNLILRGILNKGEVPGDTRKYLTAGVYTRGLKSFKSVKTKIEVSARFESGRGAWAAIWMLPYPEKVLPDRCEIDILEYADFLNTCEQTVHSGHTQTDPKNPPQVVYPPINRLEYNVYGVEMYDDKVVFFVNGKETMTYPRLNPEPPYQFWFPKYEYQLMLDMQIGGNSSHPVTDSDLPVAMYVDWVRYYELK